MLSADGNLYLKPHRFPRCRRLYRQRMQPGVEFRLQNSVYRPVAFDARLAGKGFRHYLNTHMRFARTGYIRLVAGMHLAFIDHPQALR
ncbi:hypothetical protein AGR9A_Lc40776 [Agrobacterium salinitolerans str. Hayward 0363]|nr:hypothetical protein AGR9A_Lc40776 [Agrobacterium salinitolerans str. Hayward 0363]